MGIALASASIWSASSRHWLASSVYMHITPASRVARAFCSHSSTFARTSLGITRHPPHFPEQSITEGGYPTVLGSSGLRHLFELSGEFLRQYALVCSSGRPRFILRKFATTLEQFSRARISLATHR